jgi:hypothetical protein
MEGPLMANIKGYIKSAAEWHFNITIVLPKRIWLLLLLTASIHERSL